MNAKKPTRKFYNNNESSRDERLKQQLNLVICANNLNVYTIKMDDYLKLPNKEDIDIILVKAEENAFDVRVKSFDSDICFLNESELRNQLHRMSLQKSQDGEDTQSLKMSAISNNGEKDRNFQKIPHSANDYHISQQQDMVGLTQDNNNKGQQIITRTLREVNHVIIDQESQEKQQSYKNGSNTNGELHFIFLQRKLIVLLPYLYLYIYYCANPSFQATFRQISWPKILTWRFKTQQRIKQVYDRMYLYIFISLSYKHSCYNIACDIMYMIYLTLNLL